MQHIVIVERIQLYFVSKISARRDFCAARFKRSRPFPTLLNLTPTQDSAFSKPWKSNKVPQRGQQTLPNSISHGWKKQSEGWREWSLTYDEMGSLWGRQQWQWAEILPRVNIYIRGFRYRYGAAVYGNARSSVQSVIKLLKYPHPHTPPWPQPMEQASSRRSVTSF